METPEKEVAAQIVDGSRQLAIEIKSQRELALAHPRDEKKVLEGCLLELEAMPEFAKDSFYSIPYNQGKENETKVEGLSVKMSRAAIRRWGNCAAGARYVDETADYIDCEGVFVDFETNVFFRSPLRVSKTYVPRGSKSRIPVPLVGVALTNAMQAGLSKAERNACLKGLPEYLKSIVFKEAKKLAGSAGKKEGKTIAQRFVVVYKAYEKYKVTKEMLDAYVERTYGAVGEDNADEVLGDLTGIKNALRDKHTTVEEAFPSTKAQPGQSDLEGLKNI